MFSRDLAGIRERYRRNWQFEKFRVAYRSAIEPERYAEAPPASGQQKGSRPQDWSSFRGARGGKGWKNAATGEVLYQDERPGSEGQQEQPGSGAAAAGDQPQSQAAAASPEEPQAPTRGTFTVDPKVLAKADAALQTVPQTGEEWSAWEEAVIAHPYRQEVVRRMEAYSVVSRFHTDEKTGQPEQGATFWSEEKYRRDDGSWEPERAQIHKAIVNQIVNPKARAAEGEKPKAFVLMGPPAAGKTSAGQPMATKIGLKIPHKGDAGNVTVINPDDVKAMLPEYEGWNAGIVHEESSWLAEKVITDQAIEERHHCVFDLTGKNGDKMKGIVDRLNTLGYHITVCNVQVESARAGWRAWSRFRDNAYGNHKGPEKEPGRYVPPEYAAKVVDGKPEQTYETLKHHPAVSRWTMLNTDGFEQGVGPKLVEEGER